MLGLDVGDQGVTGAKLYFEHRHPGLSRERHSPWCCAARSRSSTMRASDNEAHDPVALDFSVRDGGHSSSDLEARLAAEQPGTIRTFRELDARSIAGAQAVVLPWRAGR